MSELGAWSSFYVIVGTAAGALIGLQFVVMTLIAPHPPPHLGEGGPAYLTPTIVHFSCALMLSAILQVPWRSTLGPVACWGVIGCGGTVYEAMVARHMCAVGAYRPVFEDWLFHVILPLTAYAVLALSAVAATNSLHATLFVVGAATLMLLFAGIHNAWDMVTFHVIGDFTDPAR
jgi:hypothetical protein